MNKCVYGCGQDAKYIRKNKTECCSDNTSKCPAIKQKLRVPKPPDFKQWLKGTKGKITPANKGKSYEELFGIEKSEDLKSRMGSSIKKSWSDRKFSQENEDARREKIRNSINKRYENGWMPKAGRCKKIDYFSPIAGQVKLDGSWELTIAEYFDKIGIKWKRNLNRFSYEYESKQRFYTPDFFLKEINCYIEVKGYETEKDRAKWANFPHKLIVLKKEDIKTIRSGNSISEKLI